MIIPLKYSCPNCDYFGNCIRIEKLGFDFFGKEVCSNKGKYFINGGKNCSIRHVYEQIRLIKDKNKKIERKN
jgi:hypothetical protein